MSEDLMNRRFLLSHGVDSRSQSRAKAAKYRRRVFSRAKFRCFCCGAFDPTYGEGLVAHHIVPVDIGGHGGMSNLVSLCRSCHYTIHELSRRWIADENFGERIYDGISDKSAAKRIFKLASQQAWFDGKKLHLYPPDEVLRQTASGAMLYTLPQEAVS